MKSLETLAILLWIAVSLSSVLAQDVPESYKSGLQTNIYNDTKFQRPSAQRLITELNSDRIPWPGSKDWSMQIQGYIQFPVDGAITLHMESDNYLRIEFEHKPVYEGEKSENVRKIVVSGRKGLKYPLDIFYVHDGGKSYLKFYWSWPGQQKILIPAKAFFHTEQNKTDLRKIYTKARSRVVKNYVTIPNPSPQTLPTLQAWQRGKETLVGITFPNIPDFTCDTWCYESELDLASIIPLNNGRMQLIHTFRTYPWLYLKTLITPEPGAVSFTAWLDKDPNSEEPYPEKIFTPNICWQLKRATGFASGDEPYPEFVKRCFFFTDKGPTFLDKTDRQKIPVRTENEDVNNPPWVQNYFRLDQPDPVYNPKGLAGNSATRFNRSIIGAVSKDNKYLTAIANNGSTLMCQAWHDCMHNNPQWLPKESPAEEQIWHLKIYAMENNKEALVQRVKEDFPDRDKFAPEKILEIKNQGILGNSYQTRGLVQNMPVFLSEAKDRQTYPMSWLTGNFSDFGEWKKRSQEVFKKTWQSLPPDVPFNFLVIEEEDRGSYMAQKIVLNITRDSRILCYLLKPKGEGPFPAVLLLHDHSAIFDNGKEKVIKPWDVPQDRIASAQKLADMSYGGRFIGDKLAQRGYVCFAIDALNWGDRGGGGMAGQQALASNMLAHGMSFAGLIAHEDQRSAEFLASLSFVDKKRIAAMGLSMGAYRTWQVAAMSDHIKAGVAICWMATNKGLMQYFNNQTGGNSSYSMLHPGLFKFLDYPDVASMACPKPMLFYNGEKDKLFPIDAVNAAYDKMRQVWQSQNAADKLVTKIWPVAHEFNLEMQEEAFDWLDIQMKK